MNTSLETYRADLENKGIQVVEHECTGQLKGRKCTTCVLGVLLSENGKQIEQYMLSWLTKEYKVFCVRQPAPGTLFEYPALRYAQLLSLENGEPVLYLHTKGAANKGRSQRQTINMWKFEFVDSVADYEKNLEQFDVVLPYSGPQNITWLNGFIASPEAYAKIPPIAPEQNRFLFEILFKGTDLKFHGRRMNDLLRTDIVDNVSRMFRDIRRFSASFTPACERLHNLFLKPVPKKGL